jgi:hypothetical protein
MTLSALVRPVSNTVWLFVVRGGGSNVKQWNVRFGSNTCLPQVQVELRYCHSQGQVELFFVSTKKSTFPHSSHFLVCSDGGGMLSEISLNVARPCLINIRKRKSGLINVFCTRNVKKKVRRGALISSTRGSDQFDEGLRSVRRFSLRKIILKSLPIQRYGENGTL